MSAAPALVLSADEVMLLDKVLVWNSAISDDTWLLVDRINMLIKTIKRERTEKENSDWIANAPLPETLEARTRLLNQAKCFQANAKHHYWRAQEYLEASLEGRYDIGLIYYQNELELYRTFSDQARTILFALT
jgi:hypothetical protein